MICIAMQLSYQFFFSYLYFMNMYGANLLFNKLYKVSLSWYNTSGKGFMFRRLQICQHTIGNKSLLGQLILSISLYIIYSYVYPFFSTLTFTLDCWMLIFGTERWGLWSLLPVMNFNDWTVIFFWRFSPYSQRRKIMSIRNHKN